MKNFDTRTYNISDFIEWNNSGLLELSPDFQRRSVWSDKAKSYLIDTVLRGKPMPKIILLQRLQGSRTVRVVVDGQQRLRAILEYYDSAFRVSKAHNPEYSNHFYESLPEDLRADFLQYELGADLLFNIPYEEILDIFARINSYTVKLKKQEIFNAQYLGYFKQYVYKLGYKYVNYFVEGGILTRANVTRMAEAELSGELFVALLDKIQTNKNIENYYKHYDDISTGMDDASNKFDMVMSYLGEIYSPEDIKTTNFSRIHLFYTLFTSIAHIMYGLKGQDLSRKPNKRLTERSINRLRFILDNFSARYDEIASDLDNEAYSKDFKLFINYSRRGTTDTKARVYRTNFLTKNIVDQL